jgi:peptidoglycan/LPS O-acetylase OafA/YrhL
MDAKPTSIGLAPANHHQPELDGIRGLAILAVMLSHAASTLGVLPHRLPHPAWTPIVAFVCVPGWGGVDLFFALSGFLITGILLRARSGGTYFRSFYARRVLRIFPLYYLFLALTLAASHLFPSFAAELPVTTTERLSYLLYLQNWPLFWPQWTDIHSVWAIFWSLAAEEQFYMVWPTLIRFMSIPAMLALCVAGFALGLPLRWYLIHYVGASSIAVLHFPLGRLDGLLLGAALALYRQHRGHAVPAIWAVWSFAAGGAMLVYIAVFHVRELVGTDVHITTFGITGFALMSAGLIIASQHPLPKIRSFLTLPPLTIAGKYSYGMYVYHPLVYLGMVGLAHRISPATQGEFKILPALLFFLLAIGASTAVAILSFHFLEQPFLSLKRFFPSPNAATATT